MKTKLGISAGLVAAITYFLGLFSGYIVMALVVGYVLVCENNDWLKRAVVRALMVCLSFSLLILAIEFIPDVIGWVVSTINIFAGEYGEYISTPTFLGIFDACASLVRIAQSVVLVALGAISLKESNFRIELIDKFLDKKFNS